MCTCLSLNLSALSLKASYDLRYDDLVNASTHFTSTPHRPATATKNPARSTADLYPSRCQTPPNGFTSCQEPQDYLAVFLKQLADKISYESASECMFFCLKYLKPRISRTGASRSWSCGLVRSNNSIGVPVISHSTNPSVCFHNRHLQGTTFRSDFAE